jgi:hypothetical protein
MKVAGVESDEAGFGLVAHHSTIVNPQQIVNPQYNPQSSIQSSIANPIAN